MQPLRLRFLPALCLAALLGACATPGPPEATVRVYTTQPSLASGSTYRFERLPSQAVLPLQTEMEMAAEAMLARAGLRRDDAAGRLSVQLALSQDPGSGGPGWGGSAVSVGIGGGGGGGGVGIGLGIPIGGFGARASQQHVNVVLRDLGNGQVVFQSQASSSTQARPGALVEAALRDFPAAPPGQRQVPLANAVVR